METGVHTVSMSDYMFTPDYGDREPPARFSVEHWLLLADEGLLPDPPVELAPFPDRTTDFDVLVSQMIDWGLLGYEQPRRPVSRPETAPGVVPSERFFNDDYGDVLRLLCDATIRIAGLSMFPLRAEMRTWDIPEEAKSWNLPSESLVVPKVPFFIGVAGAHTVAAVSTQEGLDVHVEPTESSTVDQVVRLLRGIIDPGHEWPPLDISAFAVSRDFIDAAMSDDLARDGSDLTKEVDHAAVGERVREIAAEAGLGRESADAMADLMARQPAVTVALSGSYVDGDGVTVPCQHASATWALTAGRDGGSWTAGPRRGIGHRLEVFYQPATEESLTESITGLLTEMAHPAWGRDYIPGNEDDQ